MSIATTQKNYSVNLRENKFNFAASIVYFVRGVVGLKEVSDEVVHDAKSKGIPLSLDYLEELQAQERAKAITPSMALWKELAAKSGAPEWLAAKGTTGECPF